MTIEDVLDEIIDIYYRKCCWDDRKPCEYCKRFDLLIKKVLKQ